MVELMVSLLLSSLATALAFSIYVTASRGQRAQARVSEAQQTLRAASELLSRDIRQAGLGAHVVHVAVTGTPGADYSPLRITNNAYGEGPDQVAILYADYSAMSMVTDVGPSFSSSETKVGSLSGFGIGDLIIAVRNNPAESDFGKSCVIEVSGINGPDYIQHEPGGAGWNQPGNSQCDHLNALNGWDDGYTVFLRFVGHAFRIKPADPRGILQLSPSGGFIANDWQDIAVGVIDMQIAMQVYEPTDAIDLDLDGDPERDWYSGANMANALLPTPDPPLPDPPIPDPEPLRVRVSLLAKASAPGGTPQLDQTPDFFLTGAPLDNNEMGDRAGTPLPVTDPSSPYYGDTLFRWTSTVIDIRNMGVGN